MSFDDSEHLINPALLGMTKRAGFNIGGFRKQAFVPGGDPGMGGGGGGDPSAGGGAPPGGDPSGCGGAPPAGGGGGGGGGDPMASLQPMIQQAVQQAMMMQGGGAGGGGAGGAGGPGLKPKIDVNVEIMQIKNMLAKICDHLQIQIPAQDMVATPEKLTAMAQGQNVASGAGGAGAGAGGGGAIGGIPPMDPMQGAGTPGGGGEKAGSYRPNGRAFDTSGFTTTMNKAAAITRLRRQQVTA